MDKFTRRILTILTITVVIIAIFYVVDVILSHCIIFPEKKVNVVDILSSLSTLLIGCATFCLSKRMDERDKEDKERQTSSVVSLGKVNTNSVIPLSPETSNYKGENILCFSVENSGEAMLQKIKLASDDYKEFDFVSHLSIPKCSSKSVYLTLPDYFRDENKIRITFISCYGVETHGTFILNELDKECSCHCNDNCENCNYTIKHYHYNAFDAKGQ